MAKGNKFKTKKVNERRKLNRLTNIEKIKLFYDEVRIPRGTYPANKQSHIQNAIYESNGNVFKTEEILREKGFMKRKKSFLQNKIERRMKMPRKKKVECCCLFCSSKCPRCGRWEGVQVKWSPDFIIDNNVKNEITIESWEGKIEITCPDCGTMGQGTTPAQPMMPIMRAMECNIKLKDNYIFKVEDVY